MKRHLLAILLFAAATVVNAQEESLKPDAGSFSLEIGFSPFGRGGNPSIYLPMGNLTGILSVSEKFSVRLGLGLSHFSETYDNGIEQNSDDWWGWYKATASQTVFSIAPGFSYSFKGTKRLTPYVGAEFRFITASTKYEEKERNSRYTELNEYEMEGGIFDGSYPFNGYGLNAFSGFNYYFSKNIYLGAEVGIGFLYMQNKKSVIEMDNNNGSISKEETKEKYGITGFNLYANPQIRLGWAF